MELDLFLFFFFPSALRSSGAGSLVVPKVVNKNLWWASPVEQSA